MSYDVFRVLKIVYDNQNPTSGGNHQSANNMIEMLYQKGACFLTTPTLGSKRKFKSEFMNHAKLSLVIDQNVILETSR